MRPRRWTVPLACLVLVATAAQPGAASVGAAAPVYPPGRQVPVAGGTSYQLTLITGDRVRVTTRTGMPEQVVFVPHRSSRSDTAVTSYSGGHTFVIPSAARQAVASEQLDRSLFDITRLVAQRYDDGRSATLPVIVEYAGSQAIALSRARGSALAGTTNTRVLSSIGGRAAAVRKSAADAFWAGLTAGSGAGARLAGTVERVSLDDRVEVALDHSVPQIGVPAAWQRGLTGKGVKIAVLDTGVDASHPDLAGRVTSENFSTAPDAGDHYGHGTHVASIAAGTGAASGGRYKGVAPEATILSGKVLEDSGAGFESWVIEGMEWAGAQGADVANLSLGNEDPSDGHDPVSEALNRISRDTGTLFVVAAGNCRGVEPQTVGSPGASDDALTVGSTARDGSLSGFSCRGPRKGDGAMKPEITAPGEGIVAARATGTSAGEPLDDHYTTLSGTSMATPHVAGTAALLAQAQPSWQAAQLKNRLVSSADPQPGSAVSEQGAGRVDADQATDGGVSVDTAELELGVLRWPYRADDAEVRTLTYTNPSVQPVTLRLTASIDPAAATPHLSATELVVPAGGQAAVTVIANRASAGAGIYSGRITATPTAPAAADPLVTTFGWYAEPESYDLTIQGINRDGNPAQAGLSIGRPDGGPLPDLGAVALRDGKAVLRVPRGTYDVSSLFSLPATDDRPDQSTLVNSGEVHLTKDTTVVLDARRGNLVDMSVQDREDTNVRDRSMEYVRKDVNGRVVGGTEVSYAGAPQQLFAVPSDKPSTGTAEFSTKSRLEEPAFRAQIAGGPSIPVIDFHFGPRFTGTKNLPVADAGTANPADLTNISGKLALIRRTEDTAPGEQAYAAQQAGAAAVLFHDPALPGADGVNAFWYFNGEELPVAIPAMRTSRTVAADLLDRLGKGTITVKVTGVAATPYTYDLLLPWDRIPANPARKLPQSDFARIDESFGAHRDGTPMVETRFGRTPGADHFSVGWFLPVVAAPYRRTSYVLGNATIWSSYVVTDYLNFETYLGFDSSERSYRAGEHLTQRWLTPVANTIIPAVEDGTGVQRINGGLGVFLSPFGHGPDVFDDPYSPVRGEFALTVQRGSEVIGSDTTPRRWLDVPAKAGDYRISLDAKRDNAAWRYSTEIRSVWDFRSTGAEVERMPLLLADLDVPQADLLNQVRTAQPTTIKLDLRHLTGSAESAIAAATLEISYDATRWIELPLRKTGDKSYAATVTHPRAEAGKAPSLRITATDAAGGKLTQWISRAYSLTR